MGFQPLAEPAGAQGGADPRPANRPPKCSRRKHVQPWPRFQREVFDDIEGIQVPVARGHVRQIPTRRWGRATHPPNGIQSAMAFEHAPDGSQARQFAFGAGSDQRICNGLRADESQITLAQFLTQGEDAALQDDVGLTTLLARRVRLVRPIHPLQLLSARPSQPVLQVPQLLTLAPRPGFFPRFRASQYCKCPSPTPNQRATTRCNCPRRTATTIARRSFSESFSFLKLYQLT